MIKSTSVILSFILLIVLTSAAVIDKISEQQAIQLAQQFIKDNGYTKAPADRSKIKYELLDAFGNGNIDTILAFRYNELYAEPFAIAEDKDSWDIVFLSTNVDIAKLDSAQLKSDLPSRAVRVSKDGKEINMVHKEPMLSHWRKL
jgi:hypothetical protein